MPSSLNGTGVTFNDATTLQSGNIPAANLGSGTANVGTVLRGNKTWGAPPAPQISVTAGNIFFPVGSNLARGAISTSQARQLTMRAHAAGTGNIRARWRNGNTGSQISVTFTQRVYINGVAVGSEVSGTASTNNEVTITTPNISFNIGDEVAIFVRVSNVSFSLSIPFAAYGVSAPPFAPALSAVFGGGLAI